MTFSLDSAVHESLAAGGPFADRLRSYLHFADAGILEQSTWDAFGPGRSLLGVRGDASARPPVLLAAPLPDPGPSSDPLDARLRIVDLLAKLSLLADPGFPSDGRPVALAAWRPDPLGASLRALVAGAVDLPVSCAVAHDPDNVGLLRHGVAAVMLESAIRPAARFPRLHDYARLHAAGAGLRGPVPDGAFGSLLAGAARGGAVLLDVRLRGVPDLAAPSGLSADVGVAGEAFDVVPGWRPDSEAPDAVGRADPGLSRALGALARPWAALQGLFASASRDVDAAPAPARLVALDLDTDVVAACAAFRLDAMSGANASRLRDAVDLMLRTRAATWPEDVQGRLVLWAPAPTGFGAGVADPAPSPGTWGPGASLNGLADVVFALSPDAGIIVADPALAARQLAERIRHQVEGALRQRARD